MADGSFAYFSAGVPTLFYTQMRIDAILDLVDKATVEVGTDFISELCIVGLAAYIKAFCKDQFAAIINICPAVLEGFASKRDTCVAARDLLPMISQITEKLGFIVAEGCDFGSARLINGLYLDLLNITPFSKDEIKLYSEFLNDRNLLVHHGGVYTMEYARAKSKVLKSQRVQGAHWDSLAVQKDDVFRWAAFLFKMMAKIAITSASALRQFARVNKIRLYKAQREAIDRLAYYDEDTRSGRLLEA